MESPIAELFLNHSIKKLQQMTQNAEACLARLTDEQVWERTGAAENSIGNLVLHLCGNVSQWILAGVGGETDTRDRDSEFSAKGGLTRGQLAGRLSATVDQATEVIRSVSQQRLPEIINPQTGPVSVLEAIYQVVGHFQEHVGQIVFITKNRTGEDLRLTKISAQRR